MKPGGKQIIDAFNQWIDSTEEDDDVKNAAKKKFAERIVEGVFADLELDHPWLPRAVHVIPGTSLGSTWSLTDSGRGRSLASRAVERIEKIIHDAGFGVLPEGTNYDYGSTDIYGVNSGGGQ